MQSLKRPLRTTFSVVALMLGATLFVNVPVQAASCGHPGMVVSFMQRLGFGKVQPCEVIVLGNGNGNGEICANIGHHCNDGSGAGKCQSVLDTTSSAWSCQCVK